MKRFGVIVHSQEEQLDDEIELLPDAPTNTPASLEVVSHGYYICRNCKKGFGDVTGKNRHEARCTGGRDAKTKMAL